MSAPDFVVREQVLRQIQRGAQENVTSVNSGSSSGLGAIDISANVAFESPSSYSFDTPFGGRGAPHRLFDRYKDLVRQLPTLRIDLTIDDASIDWAVAGLRESSPFDELFVTRIDEAEYTLASESSRQNLIPNLVVRLEDLIAAAKEEYPETKIPTPQSISSALTFFASNPQLREPTLSLTPGGNVWAEWRIGANRSAAIEFLRNGSLIIAAIYPDPVETWRRTSLAGNFSFRDVRTLMRRGGVLAWIRR